MNFIDKTDKEFEEVFGKCNLSLCDEHEVMACIKCRFRMFLGNALKEQKEKIIKKILITPIEVVCNSSAIEEQVIKLIKRI